MKVMAIGECVNYENNYTIDVVVFVIAPTDTTIYDN